MTPSVLCFPLLLLLPHLGNSYHISDARASRQFVVRTSRSSRASTSEESCSSISSGAANGNKLPLVDWLSPCPTPNGGLASSMDVFEQRRPQAPGHTRRRGPHPVSVSDSSSVLRGALRYIVLVGYGTPAQQLRMGFDTLQFPEGISTLRCKICVSGAPPACDGQAFDPAGSSTFRRVARGPECPSVCDGSSTGCSLKVTYLNRTLAANGTFVKDTLAVSPSAAFPDFVLACMDVDSVNYAASIGVLDLSRSRLSLVSRAVSSPANGSAAAAAFSYCLPPSTRSSRGFLSFGGALPDFSGDGAGSTPLIEDPNHRFNYLIKFRGINVGGTEVPVPELRLAALDIGMSFTFLTPAMYAALRDEFRRQMAKYPVAPPYRTLDTCYNFTGLPAFDVPGISLEFDGGATLQPDVGKMMYFLLDAAPFTYGCLAFAPAPDDFPFSVVGNTAQQTVEVVYNVRGGNVGFIQQSC
ncbi:hypothetical protein ACP4OV_001352 [Aristida adscensionis]